MDLETVGWVLLVVSLGVALFTWRVPSKPGFLGKKTKKSWEFWWASARDSQYAPAERFSLYENALGDMLRDLSTAKERTLLAEGQLETKAIELLEYRKLLLDSVQIMNGLKSLLGESATELRRLGALLKAGRLEEGVQSLDKFVSKTNES